MIVNFRMVLAYDSENNTYICANGKLLKETYQKQSKSKSGFRTISSVYECDGCDGCPLKKECIKAAAVRNRS